MNFHAGKKIMTVLLAVLVIALVLSVSTFAAAKNATAKATQSCPSEMSCGTITATVTSINAKTGALTLQVRPTSGNTAALKAAITKLKVGEKFPMMAMVGKDGKLIACSRSLPLQTNARYTCPMHPDVQSSKPGKCPKCGMDLKPRQATALKAHLSK